MAGATLLQRPALGPIEPLVMYPLPDLQGRSGMGVGALRTARRQGLKVLYIAGRAYVKGADFIAYVEANAKPTK